MINVDSAVELIKGADDVAILLHQFPDGDTIGCGYALCRALQKLGKNAAVHCENAVNPIYDYILSSVEAAEFAERFVIAVDVADEKLLGANTLALYKGRIDLCIDHHSSNTEFAANTLLNGSAAAACEIMFEIILKLGVMDKDIANALYTGISTDTGCFKFANTTARSHFISAELINYGADFNMINTRMFDTKSKARLALERMALENIRFDESDEIAMVTVTHEMKKSSGVTDDDINGISGLARQIEGVKLGITLREREKFLCKVSVRTHPPYNAADFCKQFGGGGHPGAAGCEIKTDLVQAQNMLFEKAREYIASVDGSSL